MKTNPQPTKIFLLTMLVLLMYGCYPIYETVYHYTPPSSSAGMDCVTQCNKSRTQCERRETDANERCMRDAETEYNNCLKWQSKAEENCGRQAGYDEKKYNDCLRTMDAQAACRKTTCTANLKSCDAPFNTCYASCGGHVRPEQICVRNCQ